MSVSKLNDLELLDWIDAYLAENRYAPSIREVARAVGHAGSSTTHWRLSRMRRQGLVDWIDGDIRTLHTVGNARSTLVSLGGSGSAQTPPEPVSTPVLEESTMAKATG